MTGRNAKGGVERGPAHANAALRSPYSTDHAPFDGNATALTRPYLAALDIWLPEATAAAPIRAGAR